MVSFIFDRSNIAIPDDVAGKCIVYSLQWRDKPILQSGERKFTLKQFIYQLHYHVSHQRSST